jgi:hypothetical protein
MSTAHVDRIRAYRKGETMKMRALILALFREGCWSQQRGARFSAAGYFSSAQDHTKPVFDAAIRMKTDQFVLMFRRP